MKNRKQKGTTSLMAMGVIGIALTASLGVTSLSMGYMTRAKRESNYLVAYQAAAGGLEHAIAKAYASLPTTSGVYTSQSYDLASSLTEIAPGCTVTTTITPLTDPASAYATCSVTYGGVTRSVRSLINSKDVGIWNNAIFAGTGASGQTINGNVDIRGSVHILGDGEDFSDLNANGQWDGAETFTDKNKNGVWDPGEVFVDANSDGVWTSAEPYNDTNKNNIYDAPLTPADLNSSFSGTAYLGNNYSGMPTALEAMVPASPKPGGIEQLGAELRVKHGKIAVSGSASVGSNGTIDGGTSKGTLDGTYVSDGWAGNQGSSSVYADNGTSNGYDLGTLGLEFPLISGIGAPSYQDKTGGLWSSQETFLDNRSLTIPVTTIDDSTANFSYGPDAYGNSITFVKASGSTPSKLTINGIVKIAGAITLGTSKGTLQYDGNGTIYATGDMTIRSDLLPTSGKIFPTTARLGLITKSNMGLATGSGDAQLSMAGAFYAQGKITSAKQNQIAGTFVANFFDMGTNVPNIYQVPSLPQNMPPGMPGDKGYYTLKVKSWRQRS